MARSSPWSVKGVDQDARQVAREAAKRHGLTIGEWVDRAIKTRADSSEPITPAATPSELGTANHSSTTEPVAPIDTQPITKRREDDAAANSAGITFDVEQALKSARGETRENSPKDVIESNVGSEPPRADRTTVIAASSTSKFSQYSRVGLLGSAIIVALGGGLWIYDNNLSPTSPNPQQHAAVESQVSSPATKPVVKNTTPKTA